MITEEEIIPYEDAIYDVKANQIKREMLGEEFYEIIQMQCVDETLLISDPQDAKLTQNIPEIYKLLLWGLSALISTMFWLYFFIAKFLSPISYKVLT